MGKTRATNTNQNMFKNNDYCLEIITIKYIKLSVVYLSIINHTVFCYLSFA